MSFKFKTILVSTLLGLSLAHVAFAAPDHDQKDCKRHHAAHDGKGFFSGKEHLPPYLKGVDLSTAQKEQINALFEQQKPTVQAHIEKRHALMKEMHAVSHAEIFDENKATLLATQAADLEKEGMLNRAKTGNKIFALLTPEQRNRANESFQKHVEKVEKFKAQPANFKHHQKPVNEVKG